jgi:hypothetical protein
MTKAVPGNATGKMGLDHLCSLRKSGHKMVDFIETNRACNNQIKCDNIV